MKSTRVYPKYKIFAEKFYISTHPDHNTISVQNPSNVVNIYDQ